MLVHCPKLNTEIWKGEQDIKLPVLQVFTPTYMYSIESEFGFKVSLQDLNEHLKCKMCLF